MWRVNLESTSCPFEYKASLFERDVIYLQSFRLRNRRIRSPRQMFGKHGVVVRSFLCDLILFSVPKNRKLTNTRQNCNLLTLLERLFPNSRLIGPNQMQRKRWLDERGLLTEGGFPESRGRWKGREWKKLQPHNYTMRLLWLGLGVISAAPI